MTIARDFAPTPATVTPLPRVLRPARAVPSDAVRPTRAEVNLAALRHNLRVVQRAAGSAHVWAVLKADGYGHGSKAVARTLERAGAHGICVALLEEAIELREAGIRLPILVMGGAYGRSWGEIIHHRLTPVVCDAGQIEALAEEVRYQHAGVLGVHLKVDTGMARLGASPTELPTIAHALCRSQELRLEGLMTHFACADELDASKVSEQTEVFEQATVDLRRLGFAPALRHASNSAALLRFPHALYDAVRPGLALFGVEPLPGVAPELRPVMSIRTEIVALRSLKPGQTVGYGATWKASRPSIIATIPIGYADGLSRALSNRGSVLVRGRRAPIVGVVSMDMAMIDVTDFPGARVGDEAAVLGIQKGPLGEDHITAAEIASQLSTIPWEVLTNVSRRVPRFYREP